MIRRLMKNGDGNGQRGGIAILTALGFLLFSIPLITASLDLAQNTSIDSRVKTGIMHRQYCGLAVREYLDYLLVDSIRWTDWLADNIDPNDPTGATSTETLNPCGNSITITVTQQSVLPADSTTGPLGDPLATIPPLSSYSNRNFQTFKTVSDPNPNGGDSVTYTITVINRDATATTLVQIEETLPAGFSYDCNAPPDQLTLPGMGPQNIVPDGGPCPTGNQIEWDMAPGTSIEPGETVTLAFTAVTSVNPGIYCNEVQIVPGGDKTRSGKTAVVQIGPNEGLCPGQAVAVSKRVESIDLVSTDINTSPYTYTFDVDYTIEVDNIGSEDLTIAGFINLLPVGFSYVSTSPSGDITSAPSQVLLVSQVDRQRLTWVFNPTVLVASGAAITLTYSTTAAITQGNYWSDLLVDFGGGAFPEDRYSWPTALVSVKNVYTVTATSDEGDSLLIALQVWTGDQNGIIKTWTIR